VWCARWLGPTTRAGLGQNNTSLNTIGIQIIGATINQHLRRLMIINQKPRDVSDIALAGYIKLPYTRN